jgi:Fe2+ transport system protein FeoA
LKIPFFLTGENLTTVNFMQGDSMKKLSQLGIGERATVVAVNGEGAIRRRLFDMGITPGTEIYLRKKAPLGDPIEITLRGYELTLRKAEAEKIEMEAKL